MKAFSEEKLVYSVDEVAKILAISRPVAYELTKKPGFPAVRVSPRRIVIPKSGLEKWLAQQGGGED